MNLMLPLLAIIALISGEQLLNALVVLVIWGVIMWVLWWGLHKIAPPEPWLKVGTVILVIITVVVLVNLLLGLIGKPIIHW
jgi:hypothetical protein